MESLAVQRQIRENASYLQDYFSDMSAWEKSMAKKEQQLQGSKRSAAPVRRAVAMSVRGSDGSVSIQHPLNATIDTPIKPMKAPSQHVYDKGYNKWDSFDVDAALKEVDTPSVTPHQDEEDPEEAPPARPTSTRPKKAVTVTPKKPSPPPVNVPRDLLEKEDGNMHFKQGEFAAAVNCYSRSLSYNPRNPIVLSNRAMAHLKLQQFGKAKADCTAALAVDGGYVKSLVRRASARNALGKHHAAFADLENALKLDSTSKATIATQLKSTHADLFSELLEALLGFSADRVDFALEFMAALTRVPRFAMVSMFVTAKEKEQVVAFAAGHIRRDEIVAAFT
ncbi:hypothetical protein DYB37_003220 [Aphanomyces astaci]|uniref:RNA polymerase II-associated protein 3 n=1 Tax=Aphanomyces astaci TaxID=112090 RepID=A0A418F8S9_APHAT|nr:hypothetical protein DYB37_003220 [Aphanomyces astaci]